MFYTGINPLDMKPVHVVTDYHEKQLQRALLQYNRPENADLVREALKLAGREDLIGFGPECLVRPAGGHATSGKTTAAKPALGRPSVGKSGGGKPTGQGSNHGKQDFHGGGKGSAASKGGRSPGKTSEKGSAKGPGKGRR